MSTNCPECGWLNSTDQGKKHLPKEHIPMNWPVVDVIIQKWRCRHCHIVYFKNNYDRDITTDPTLWNKSEWSRPHPYSDDMVEGTEDPADVYEKVIQRSHRLPVIYTDPARNTYTWAGLAKRNRERLEKLRHSHVRRGTA